MDVKFAWFNGCQNEIASIFAKSLSSSVTHMKLDFSYCRLSWRRMLSFEELCFSLKENCSDLHTLTFYCGLLEENLPSVIDLCSAFFPNLKALIFTNTIFGLNYKKRELAGISKIKVLTVFGCLMDEMSIYTFPKMPYLEKINFTNTCINDNWFLNNENGFPLHQLQILHIGYSNISSINFRALKSCAVNLIELFLCGSILFNDDLSFHNTVFPFLKTICLRHVKFVTCEGLVSLVQSCPSLQNIYVDRGLAESYANHSFVITNTSESRIVKAVDSCDHSQDADCLLDE